VPIYEFYCADCHTVFSFFSARVAPEARPACPRCGRPELPRRPSRFATISARGPGEEEGTGGLEDQLFGQVDEARLERAFEAMATEFEGLEAGGEESEPDPRQMSRALRRFTELTGLEAGPRMREMLDRLERGEDPEALEADLGTGEDGDDDLAEFFQLRSKLAAARSRRPEVDETLHFL
jgi:putative FmdB family regulatory protein